MKKTRKELDTAAYNILKEWCDVYSFVPTPKCLAHFGGGKRGLNRWAYGYAFKRLQDEGYKFEQISKNVGYKVKRPVVAAQAQNTANTEAIEAIKRDIERLSASLAALAK